MANSYHEALERVERDHWWFQAMRRVVSELLQENVPAPARVLDIGCSTGHLLSALPASYELTGIDFSHDAVEAARRLRPSITFDVGSIEALPLKDSSFDAVLAIDVISADGVGDDRRAVGELMRVLRPGGTLIAQVAAYEWLRSGHDVAAGTARRYTAPRFEQLITESGLEPLQIGYRVSSVFPLAVPWRLLRRRSERSDVAPLPGFLNKVFAAAMASEHSLAKRGKLPFGLSVLAVARRP